MSDAPPRALPPRHSRARALLELLAMLDPDGFPDTIMFGTFSALTYVQQAPHRDPDAGLLRRLAGLWGGGGTLGAVMEAARAELARHGIIQTTAEGVARIDPGARDRALAELDPAAFATAARTAADMLADRWTDLEEQAHDAGRERFEPEDERLMRAATAGLVDTAGDALWRPEAHAVVFLPGHYLRDSGQHESSLAYWRDLVREAERIMGAGHPSTLAARDHLAAAQRSAGDTAAAVTAHEAVLNDRLRALGPDHADILASRHSLAVSYHEAGLGDRAVALLEEALRDAADRGNEAFEVSFVRDTLAETYAALGRHDEAIAVRTAEVARRTRRMGAKHTYTLRERISLGGALRAAGRTEDAVSEYRAVVAACNAQRPGEYSVVPDMRDEAVAALAELGSDARSAW